MKKILFTFMLPLCAAAGMAQNPNLPVDVQGYYLVSTLQEFQDAVKNDLSDDGKVSYSRIKLTSDLYLSDLSERTFNNTFYGEIEGDGHTIWAARPEVQHDGGGHYKRTYLFTVADHATFRNLTFRDIRVEHESNDKQSVIASNAVRSDFINITMDNISVFGDEDYVGTISGKADHCTFENVVVKNSDITTDAEFAGAIVGYCCNETKFEHCTIDNKTSVYADGTVFYEASVGAIVGRAENSTISSCVSQAVVGGDFYYIGGFVGNASDSKIESCLNAGLTVGTGSFSEISEAYRNQSLPSRSVPYGGTVYKIHTLTSDYKMEQISYIGGIVGKASNCQILSCTNLGDFFSGGNGIGGIAGDIEQSNTIVGCSNYGTNKKEGGGILGAGGRVGGIVGDSKGHTIINNCLNTQKVYADTLYAYGDGGIVGYLEGSLDITNCLSTVSQRILCSKSKSSESVSTSNNYVLVGERSDNYCSQVTAEELASGVVARKLNSDVNNAHMNPMPWRQNLTGDVDAYPVLDPTHDVIGDVQPTFTINSADDLIAFADLVNSGSVFATGELYSDIDMAMASRPWTPIGKSDSSFRGLFDGHGHTIDNLVVSGTNVGLFGVIDEYADIRNVIIGKGSVITSTSDTGGAAGIVGAVMCDARSKGTVTIKNCGSYASVTAKKYAGGILGKVDFDNSDNLRVQISGCFNMGTITASEGNSALLCGYTQNYAVVRDCWSLGELKSSNSTKPYDSSSTSGKDEFFVGYDSRIDIGNCFVSEKQVPKTDMGQVNVFDAPAYMFANGNITFALNYYNSLWQQNIGTDTIPVWGGLGIHHARDINNEYGTICLPFPIWSDDEIAFYTLSEVTTTDDEVNLQFSYAEKVESGTPVIFRAKTLGERTFVDAQHPADNHDFELSKKSYSGAWTMMGTHTEKVFEGKAAKNIYYVSNGAIRNASKVTIAPFRAYFRGPSIEELTGSGKARVRIVIDGEENEAAALELVTDDSLSTGEGRGEAYTLFGTEAGEGYRGIVIRGGKLTINN